ncbi:MAG: FAD-dependent oxidoreductase [Oligoflexia bacterium]|nr:FAD-dependent oxidoreductase [Oligoflexia bacterium]
MSEKWISRRSVLKAGLVGAVGAGLGGAWFFKSKYYSALAGLGATGSVNGDPSPISKIFETSTLKDYTGDDPHRAHPILWDKTGFLKKINGRPSSSENTSVIIVGGGISGLASAYYLRDQKPILLEQASQFGGNSKGEKWEDISYSIGAAYITRPSVDSPAALLLKDLNLLDFRNDDSGNAHVLMGNAKKIISPFWSGATDPARAAEFKSVHKTLIEFGEKTYPDIPWNKDSTISKTEYDKLDRLSFAQWSQSKFQNLHPHIAEFFNEYAWSAFAGGVDEISAAQMIGFLASDLVGITVFPGGNAAIAQAMYERLKNTLPENSLRANSLVLDVRTTSSGVEVTYTQNGETKTISAKACVFAAPKFVAKRVIENLPATQLEAMQKIKYRAYLVANVLLNKKFKSPSYDLFRLTPATITDPAVDSKSRAFTDVIFASWAAADNSQRSVLTLYHGCPYDGARGELYSIDSFSNTKALFESSLPDLLSALSLSQSDVEDLRITRWGHALPLAEKGLLADGFLELAHQAIENRIFFAHQDNWANPCFETALSSAIDATSKTLQTIKM